MVMTFTRRGFLGSLILSVAAYAAGPVPALNKDKKNVALKGYDAVAYFEQGKPVKGSPEFIYEWKGASWMFASAHDRDTFVAMPEKYAPQFGGYCAWAVSNNYTADADPEAWKIVDGKLYVNYSRAAQEKWEKDLYTRIADGNKNWPALHE
jgi:hypothetical protein